MPDPNLTPSMPRPGVRAYHVIFAAYGFWLPNDPRGSWSDFVGSWELLRFGPATTTAARRSVAHSLHDAELRRAAKEALRYPPVVFDGRQALDVIHGFARMTAKAGYVVHACAILPEHVHMVIRRHRYRIEQVVRLLKAAASEELATTGRHPFAEHTPEDGPYPTPWARGCWKVFLNTDEDIARAIRYVEDNPVREGKRPQRWPFVVPLVTEEAEAVAAERGSANRG